MTGQTVSPPEPPTIPWWQALLVGLWLTLFAVCFYQFDLPNSSPKVNRTLIWEQLPALLVNAVDPPEPVAQDAEARLLWKQSGWSVWPQRFGLYGISLVILTGAWAWGSLLLRMFQLPLARWSAVRLFFSLTVGLSAVSLGMLGCGLAGLMSRPLLLVFLGCGLVIELLVGLLTLSSHDLEAIGQDLRRLHPRRSWPLLICLPFLMCYVGGGFLPETDFDVKEYHFGGPKEWYQAGQITFLPHNVYTSFPFLTEMLVLLGMVLYGDWYWGALAGKGVLMCFGPLTALGIYVAGRRWFSPAAGFWGAFIHLSTPWIYRISIIAYAEGGLACYLWATTLAVLFYAETVSQTGPIVVSPIEPDEERDARGAWGLLAGWLAGSAMACKYPGVISVVIPCGLALLVLARRLPAQHQTGSASQPVTAGHAVRASLPASSSDAAPASRSALFRTGLLFAIGVGLTIGPWLAKNLAETGNPIYPLLYNVFGGVDWDAELNAKFRHGHSPDHHHLSDLAIKLMDVTLKSDWLSPLLFGLAPLALLASRKPTVRWLWGYVAYLFLTWWLLTHRIDRFWVPLIPVVSLLAGIGATWNPQTGWRWLIGTVITLASLFNFGFITSSLCGYNAYLLDLNRAAEQTARITAPEIVYLNQQLPEGAKVLCIGEAELFDARFPYVYNTVFDRSIFEDWLGDPAFQGPSAQRPLKTTGEITTLLQQQQVTHIFVNWQEILRYRMTYSYTDFVTPKTFQELQSRGILDEGWPIPGGRPLTSLTPRERDEIARWAPELIRHDGSVPVMRTFDIFPVASMPSTTDTTPPATP